MMEATHGTWGERIKTFRTDNLLVTILKLKKHQQCSWHFHNTRFDQFYVVSGKLGIETDKGHTTVLSPGQTFTVEPGVKHKFITYDYDCIVQEISFTIFMDNDIHRIELGGPVEMKTDEKKRS